MRIVIVGAGSVGRSIARELLTNGHAVLLVDKDPAAIRVNSVPDAEWLLADACEISALAEAGLVVAGSGERRRVRFRLESAPMRVAQQFLAALARDWDGPLASLRDRLGEAGPGEAGEDGTGRDRSDHDTDRSTR